MKITICAILGIAVIGGSIALYASRQDRPAVAQPPVQAVASCPVPENNPPAPAPPAAPAPVSSTPTDTGDAKPALVAATAKGAGAIDAAVSRTIENLLSARMTHEQRRAALKELVQSGKIDQAINELQQRMADAPHNADYETALGQAYLEKGVALADDFPDKAIMVMQAVKSFDAALSDDPSDWEARITRTAIMSHYPAEMNKGPEVIDQFTLLINQQESLPPQSQFALTYVLLGDQYQKLGQNDYALATWQAGAQLFPGDKTLRKRLAGQ